MLFFFFQDLLSVVHACASAARAVYYQCSILYEAMEMQFFMQRLSKRQVVGHSPYDVCRPRVAYYDILQHCCMKAHAIEPMQGCNS